jgi:chaperonin cofactor prefoldin
MSKLEKPGSRTSRSLISMAFEVAQQNEILQARIEVLERENKRLRATLDAVRETSLDAQTEALRDRARRVVLISPRQKKVA